MLQIVRLHKLARAVVAVGAVTVYSNAICVADVCCCCNSMHFNALNKVLILQILKL